MSRKKYQYVLECYGWGGEFSIHTVTQEFFDHMNEMDEDERGEFVSELQFMTMGQAELESLPQIKPDEENNNSFEWHEGDIEHATLPTDVEVGVFEVPEGEDATDEDSAPSNYVNGKKLHSIDSEDIDCIYSLECYNEQGEGDPTVGFYSEAKGFMGNFILESNEPFDPKYLFKGQIETNFNNFIDGFYYGRTLDDLEEVDWIDHPEGDGKSFQHNVGYVNTEDLDKRPEDIKKSNDAKWLFEDLE